jgi:exodeoxyribonuclease VII small subunit
MNKKDQPDNPNPTFEQALAELEKIVAEVEQGRVGLEDSIQKYEKGMALIQFCRDTLDAAEKRIETISRTSTPPAAQGG